MGLIDWTGILSRTKGSVHFSTMSESIPKSILDVTLSSLQLSQTHFIEVLWRADEKKFLVTLFIDPLTTPDLDNEIDVKVCSTVNEVVGAVESLIAEYVISQEIARKEFLSDESKHRASAKKHASSTTSMEVIVPYVTTFPIRHRNAYQPVCS